MLNIYLALAPMILYASSLFFCAIPTILRSVDLNITWIEQILIKLGSYFKIFTLNHLDIILFGNCLLTNSHILLMSVSLYVFIEQRKMFMWQAEFSHWGIQNINYGINIYAGSPIDFLYYCQVRNELCNLTI